MYLLSQQQNFLSAPVSPHLFIYVLPIRMSSRNLVSGGGKPSQTDPDTSYLDISVLVTTEEGLKQVDMILVTSKERLKLAE